MEINSHYKSRIVLSPFTEIDDQLGRNSPLCGRPDAKRNICAYSLLHIVGLEIIF